MLIVIIILAAILVLGLYELVLYFRNKGSKKDDKTIIVYSDFCYSLISNKSLWLKGREGTINSFSINKIKDLLIAELNSKNHLQNLLAVIKKNNSNLIPSVETINKILIVLLPPFLLQLINNDLFDFTIFQQLNSSNYMDFIHTSIQLLVLFMIFFIFLIGMAKSIIDSIIIPNNKNQMMIMAIEELLEQQNNNKNLSHNKIPYRYQPKKQRNK